MKKSKLRYFLIYHYSEDDTATDIIVTDRVAENYLRLVKIINLNDNGYKGTNFGEGFLFSYGSEIDKEITKKEFEVYNTLYG